MNTVLRTFSHRFLVLLVALGLIGLPGLASAEIKLGISDWPGWVAWYIAEKEGYFKKYGADVKLIWFTQYTDSIQALSAGRLDANSQALIDSLAPFSKGLPLKTIMVTDNSAGNDAIMAKPSIKTVRDLKGKTVALNTFALEAFLLHTALKRHGMTESEIKQVNMHTSDAAAAFIAGKVDAAAVWNPWINRIVQSGQGRALFTSKQTPGLIPDLIVAQEKSIQAHRKEYVAMIRAWFDVVKFVHAHPEAAAKIMAPYVSLQPKTYAVFLSGTRFFGPKLNLEAMAPGTSTVSLYKYAPAMAQFLISKKELKSAPELSKFIDASLLKQAVAESK